MMSLFMKRNFPNSTLDLPPKGRQDWWQTNERTQDPEFRKKYTFAKPEGKRRRIAVNAVSAWDVHNTNRAGFEKNHNVYEEFNESMGGRRKSQIDKEDNRKLGPLERNL